MPRVLLLLILALLPQAGGELDKVLEKADALFEESRTLYESAREKSAVQGFIDAGFRLEEARIKYLVLQEIGAADKQKIAGDRLRALNQLTKLIHDGKVAISGKAVVEPAPKPAEPPEPADPAKPAPDAGAPPAPAIKPPVDVRVRLTIPDAARQKEAEKMVREIFKDQYAKKAAADRQALARLLLEKTKEAAGEPAALWVMYRDAQEYAVGTCDVATALASIEGVATFFDVDPLAMKNAALAAAAKSAKTPEDYAALAAATLALVEDLVAADQYDVADKAMAAALAHAKKSSDASLVQRVTSRSHDVAEAKSRFQSMKGALETLAKNPADPAANNDMGQLLCFIKGNWDLGVRFLAKGSDPTLKALAEKELALPTQAAEQAVIGDGWWDLAEKEKSPLRKTQMLLHARSFYEAALPGLAALQKMKVEKRLESSPSAPAAPAVGGPVTDLLKLLDTSKDVVAGTWTLKGSQLVSDGAESARVEFPYEPAGDYDFRIVFVRNEGGGDVFQSLTRNGKSFLWSMSAGPHYGFGDFNGRWICYDDCQGQVVLQSGIVNGKTHTSLVQVRKDGVKGFLDGKLIKELKDPYGSLGPHQGLQLRKDTLLGVGSFGSPTTFLKIELVEFGAKGKRTRN
jgi:hypothetical protein